MQMSTNEAAATAEHTAKSGILDAVSSAAADETKYPAFVDISDVPVLFSSYIDTL